MFTKQIFISTKVLVRETHKKFVLFEFFADGRLLQ